MPANTVFFTTTQGLIPVQLTPGTTPRTVANFLSYVTSDAYDNTIVHRSVAGFIWQGGGFNTSGAAIPAGPSVVNEYSSSHPNVRGTIAMAKLGSGPDTATDQWFFNEADNSQNLDNQNGGFTTFGSVIGNGLSVIDAIGAIPTYDQSGVNPAFNQLPLTNYTSGPGPAEQPGRGGHHPAGDGVHGQQRQHRRGHRGRGWQPQPDVHARGGRGRLMSPSRPRRWTGPPPRRRSR